MENNKNINWGWILTAVFGIFGFWVMTDLIQSEREVKEKQRIIDSLSNEVLLLEEEDRRLQWDASHYHDHHRDPDLLAYLLVFEF